MKVLLINGSPRKNGNCARLLTEAEKIFAADGVEVVRYDVGAKDIRGCMACGGCAKKGECVIGSSFFNLFFLFLFLNYCYRCSLKNNNR